MVLDTVLNLACQVLYESSDCLSLNSRTLEQEAFALANLRLRDESEGDGFYVFANNLFDTEYVTQAFELSTGTVGTFGAPRTLGVQIRAQF